MSEFEWELVRALNEFLGDRGIAYRLKQHRYASQIVDILVDSPMREFYCGIECKSLSQEKGASALYFSQHFTISKEGHQIERISEFLRRSGRTGILALEVRRGTGRSRTTYLIPWKEVERRFLSGEPGISLKDLEGYPELLREGKRYLISEELWKRVISLSRE